MNRVFKTIWNRVEQRWVVASETAKSSRSGHRQLGQTRQSSGSGVRFVPQALAFCVVGLMGLQTANAAVCETTTGLNGSMATGIDAFACGTNNDAIGKSSSAIGHRNVAMGHLSSAIGRLNTASGQSSSAMGYLNKAAGSSSSAIGTRAGAVFDGATAVGGATNQEAILTVEAGILQAVNGVAVTATGAELSTITHVYGVALNKSQRLVFVNSINSGGALAFGQNSTALGAENTAIGSESLAVGFDNTALHSNNTAVGSMNLASGYLSTAIGHDNTATNLNSVAMGHHNTANGHTSSAVGLWNMASEQFSSAFGLGNTANDDSSAIGNNNTAQRYSTALGNSNSANSDSTAVGRDNIASGFSVSVGDQNTSRGYQSSSVGRSNTSTGEFSSALGNQNHSGGVLSTAVGLNNVSENDYSSTIGRENTTSGAFSTAIGNHNVASGASSSAVGLSNMTAGQGAIAYGVLAGAVFNGSTAIGGAVGNQKAILTIESGKLKAVNGILVTATSSRLDSITAVAGVPVTTEQRNAFINSIDYGGALAFGQNSTAIGAASVALDDGSTALGLNSQALSRNSVALGQGSIANRDNAVSVGAIGYERQITNVAAGTKPTDAVNLTQLQYVVNTLGGGASLSAPTYLIQGSTYGDVGGAFAAVDDKLNDLQNQVDGTAPSAKMTTEAKMASTAPLIAKNTLETPDSPQLVEDDSAASTTITEQVATSGVMHSMQAATNSASTTKIADAVQSTDPVNLGQMQAGDVSTLNSARQYTDTRFGRLERDLTRFDESANAGVASALAIGNLPQPTQAGRNMLSVGSATHNGQQAIAVGLSTVTLDNKYVIKGGFSTNTNKDASGSIAVGLQW